MADDDVPPGFTTKSGSAGGAADLAREADSLASGLQATKVQCTAEHLQQNRGARNLCDMI